MEQFDLLIIGSGPAGAAAAFKARSLGLGVCLVEKADIGGTCLNRGCIPTKVFLHGAKLLRDFREAERFGIDAGEPRFDFSRLSGWKDTVVQNLRKNQTAALLKAGVRMEAGEARIEEPGCVSIGAGKYAGARAILVAAGTAPARLPVQGNDLDGVYSSDDFLDGNGVFAKGDLFTGGPAPGVPKRLTIIGGGVIGVEFAAAYSAFGSELTVIEALPSLLASMDREIGQNLALLLKKRGVRIMTGVRISAIEKTGGVLRTLFSAPPDGSGGAE
ncbi:MAG: FAD-dependent oxidoreductase, partial [Spirochaetaceae bacterium]|nr:FAD-dependent oxidoreductase [Spirochaetaceae bacterium]